MYKCPQQHFKTFQNFIHFCSQKNNNFSNIATTNNNSLE